MTSRFAFGALAGAVVLASAASAGVTVTTNKALWTYRVTSAGQSVGTETFDSFSGAYLNPISGTLGSTYWTASADQGLFATGGVIQTLQDSKSLVFTFSPGVRSVAGNIFATDSTATPITSVVNVTLSDGTAYTGTATKLTDFVGFTSTTANITSLSITVQGASGSGIRASIDNLYLAIPAPGAAALVGVAALASRRRRIG